MKDEDLLHAAKRGGKVAPPDRWGMDTAPLTASLEVRDRKSGEVQILTKNVYTGQWKHPKWKMDVCGIATNTDINVIDTGARYTHCLAKAGHGTDHVGSGPCERHRGNRELPNRRAQLLLRDIAARKALASLAVSFEISPTDALLALVHEAAGNVAFLGGRVADLGLQLVGDVYALTREGDPVATSEDARAIVKLYNEERDRLAKVAKMAIDAGIEERQVRVLEDQAVMMAQVLRATIVGLALPPEVQRQAFHLLAQELRAVGPGL